jgi:ABC-type antimicrobial peptide transport system permease subunit
MKNLALIFRYAFKDLIKQKVRTVLGIIGVTISVGLLAIVLFLSDSISVSFVDYLSADAGGQDMVISIRHYRNEPENRSSYFDYDPIIEKIEDVSDDIEDFIPRMEVDGIINISGTSREQKALISGIDFSLEEDIDFGTFLKPDSDDKELKLKELDLYHCAIYYGFNDKLDYEEGERIYLNLTMTHGNLEIQKRVSFTIDEIFDYEGKWSNDYRLENLIVVDIDTLYHIFGDIDDFRGKCTKIILTFSNIGELYDIRDIEGSKIKIKKIAGDIQEELGLKEYTIELPKLELLDRSEFLSMAITVVFIFVSIVAMMISGILINGILKTSIEERIREFGIFRTLGAYKNYNLAIVLLQGFLLCNFGAILGVVTAFFETQFIIIPFANEYLLSGMRFGEDFAFYFTWYSIIIAYSMGITVGLIVSISPALKVKRLQLIESIHPYRHEDTLYHLQKRSSVNYKLVIAGIVLALNGGFVMFVIPRLIVAMNITLMATTFIVLLLVFSIGLTLTGLGLMPIVLRLVIQFFRLGIFRAKRLINVIKIFVFRYQRRNSSTIIITALSFSFVIFASIVIQTQSSQVATGTSLQYGSDLLMETVGWKEQEYEYDGGLFGGSGGGEEEEEEDLENVDPNRIMTTEFEEKLLSIDGVEKVSSVLATPWQLTQIYSDEDKEFEAEIGDYAGVSTEDITLISIDEDYVSTVDTELVEMTRGDLDEAFDELFESDDDYTCIISEAIALELKLNLEDKIRIFIERGDEQEKYEFKIVGMASSMPGFLDEFSGTRNFAHLGGVLVSQKTYLEIIDIPEPAWVSKIFIKIKEDDLDDADSIEEDIDDLFENDYDYEIYNLNEMVERQQAMFAIVDALFMLILGATVFICLFGLLSSSYSTIIERKKEIGIIRTLGLKGREINRMFILEALIIMLSAGTVGILVGYFTGWLVTSNLALFSDLPYNPVFPYVNSIILYLVSLSFIWVGMYLMLRKSRKKKIVDIYRETM